MNAVVDFPVKPEARPYLDAFPRAFRHLVYPEPEWLIQARRAALNRFAETGFPTRRSEAWRYIDLQSLERQPLLPGDVSLPDGLSEQLAELELPDQGMSAVMRDGHVERVVAPEGAKVWFNRTFNAIGERDDLFEDIVAALPGGSTHPLAALNGALFSDGYILDVAQGVSVEHPIEIVHLASGQAESSFHTRSLIRLGKSARATIIEAYVGNNRYWRNDVVDVELAEGAVLNRTAIVEESTQAVHTALTEARLGTGARYKAFALLLGGSRVRYETNVRLGKGAQCEINGAYIVGGSDEANIVTVVDHAAPGGQTRELIKGVAAERGHGAFQGRVIVREHAQKTDAHQLSRNLIIGRRAVIDTKPELEIYADDVKCSHGASVGDLDETALFYLRARGIPEEEARRMLIEGFLREAVEQIDDRAVREHLLGRLAGRLARLEG